MHNLIAVLLLATAAHPNVSVSLSAPVNPALVQRRNVIAASLTPSAKLKLHNVAISLRDSLGMTDGASRSAVAAAFPGVNFAVQSDTLIRVDTPAAVSSGPISVRSSSGTWTTSSNFFVPPAISNFTANAGRAGTNITINGINLLGATNVSFNGIAAANYTVLSNKAISASVPPGATTGLIRVTTPAGSAFSVSRRSFAPATAFPLCNEKIWTKVSSVARFQTAPRSVNCTF